VFEGDAEEHLALACILLQLLSVNEHVLFLLLLDEVHELKFCVGEVQYSLVVVESAVTKALVCVEYLVCCETHFAPAFLLV